MKLLFIIAIAIIIFGVINYDKISYKKWYERCEISSKHPAWYFNCRKDFLEEDTLCFIDNGYGEYVRY